MTTNDTLSGLSDAELLDEVKRLASVEREATVDLICSLCEVEARQLHLAIGCSSMFSYCYDVLHLSEHAAYARIATARAARRYPLVLDLLREGSITLTTVTLLRPHLTAENHSSLLAAARHKRKVEVAMMIATLCPEPDVPASIRPIAPERYELQVTIGADTCAKLRRAQDLLRQSETGSDEAAVIDRALTLLVEQLEKAKFARTDRPRLAVPGDPSSRSIPAAVRRAVSERDAYRCAFVGTNGRCTATAFLEYHHHIPFAEGGPTTVANLELRCRAHNAYQAERWFGPLFVRERFSEWVNSVQTEFGRSV